MSANTVAWSEQDDDHAAFEEAMVVADVALREIEAKLDKLKNVIRTLHRANTVSVRDGQLGRCLAMCNHIESLLQTPPVTRWRQKHSEGRGRRHAQQHVLEVKLALARELLDGCGIDFDAECAKRRMGS